MTAQFFILLTLFLWLATRPKPVFAQLITARIPGEVAISAELLSIPEKLSRIWSSTRDIFLRKLSYPFKTNYRYGLEFDIKNNKAHVFLCILLARILLILDLQEETTINQTAAEVFSRDVLLSTHEV